MAAPGKPKRMSEMFASSSGQDADTTMITSTPPYSSEGPTLPLIGASEEHLKCDAKLIGSSDTDNPRIGKKRKAQDQGTGGCTTRPPQTSTIHPYVYTPWNLLPPELLKLLESQSRLRTTQNVVAVVFSKNQSVKSGINRLKTYLGNYRTERSMTETPDSVKLDDALIAISAQGEGTTKLVGIVDLVRRIVAPKDTTAGEGQKTNVEKWWMYSVLSSVDVEMRTKNDDGEKAGGDVMIEKRRQSKEESIVVADGEDQSGETWRRDKRTIPVLTVWMTRKKIPAFENAFGEQMFMVQRMMQEQN